MWSPEVMLPLHALKAAVRSLTPCRHGVSCRYGLKCFYLHQQLPAAGPELPQQPTQLPAATPQPSIALPQAIGTVHRSMSPAPLRSQAASSQTSPGAIYVSSDVQTDPANLRQVTVQLVSLPAVRTEESATQASPFSPLSAAQAPQHREQGWSQVARQGAAQVEASLPQSFAHTTWWSKLEDEAP